MATLIVYSQNVSGDKHSESVPKINGLEEWTFENRLRKIIQDVSHDTSIDVVAFNEVRNLNVMSVTI